MKLRQRVLSILLTVAMIIGLAPVGDLRGKLDLDFRF